MASLDIVDRGLITKVVGQPSTRSYFRVITLIFINANSKVDAISKTESTYFCWSHYCSCKTFIFSVNSKEEALMVCRYSI